MFTSDSLTVVTAATGHRNLRKCLDSVQRQTFENVEHLVVVDGDDRKEAVDAALTASPCESRARRVITLPHATGKEKWNGHRIYGAMSLLCNSEHIAFLDEDNWLDPEHFEEILRAIRSQNAAWGFSLRKIWSVEGELLGYDKCESLGTLHPVVFEPSLFLVDTSAYVIRRELAALLAPLWYRPARPPAGTIPADRMVCSTLMKHHPVAGASKRYTLNYTVGNRSDSVQAAMFVEGNRRMLERYPEGMPWERG